MEPPMEGIFLRHDREQRLHRDCERERDTPIPAQAAGARPLLNRDRKSVV